MSDMAPAVRAWGFFEHGVFVALPKAPMIAAGYTSPPFVVTLPLGQQRHVVLEPEAAPCPDTNKR